MAGPIALAIALARTVSIQCPHCGQPKRVARDRTVAFRRCPRCHKQFPDPLAQAAAARKRR